MTVGIDLGYIKTILSHAAAVHGVVISTEPIDLARIALGRLGLVEKAMSVIAAPRRTNSIVLSARHWRQTFGNKFRLVVSSNSRSQRQCGKMKLQELSGATSTPAAECSSFEIGRIPERKRETTNEFLCWMYQAMTHARSLRSKAGSRIFAKAGFFPTADDPLEQHFVANAVLIENRRPSFSRFASQRGAARLFEAGFSIEQVALVTGHKIWKMLRRYTHLKPGNTPLNRFGEGRLTATDALHEPMCRSR